MAVEPLLEPPAAPTPASGRERLVGLACGILTGLCWATSPVLIRKGLEGLPSPTWGVTVGSVAATIVLGAWVAVRRPAQLRAWRTTDGRTSLRTPFAFLLIAGAAYGFGSVARAVAIDLAPVVIVLPLVQTATLFTAILSPLLLGRHVEHVPPRLLFGAILVVIGSSLVLVGLDR
jgi:drug/metabolite transporter (DMT)-like permease